MHSIQLSSSLMALDMFSANLKIFFLQPKPLQPPQNQQPLQEGLAKGKNLPAAPVGDHIKQRQQCHSIPVPCQNPIWDISLGTQRG